MITGVRRESLDVLMCYNLLNSLTLQTTPIAARSKKQSKLGWGKVGKISSGKSYVPAGLTASQYSALRSKEKVREELGM